MKIKVLFFALFILASIIVNAQPAIEWQKCLGGTGEDRANSIQQTSDGGYIVAGYSKSNNGNVTGNHGYFDYWIVKLNSVGTIEWQKSLGGTNLDYVKLIKQTEDGGYIVVGGSASNDGDVTGNHGGNDYWIVKLDSEGGIEWQKSLGGTNSDFAYSIQQTTDGGYIVAGESYSNDGDVTGHHGTTSYSDYWIVKLNNVGDIEWQKSLGGTGYEAASTIQQTKDGGFIVAGYSASNDGDVTGHHGQAYKYDYWIVKLSSVGEIEWQKSFGGTENDAAWSIIQTKEGGFIVAGWSYSNDGDATGHHGTTGNYDSWIVKLNNIGSIEWKKSLGGSGDDEAYSIIQTKDEGYIIASYSRSNDGDVTSNHGSWDNWIVKLNSTGDIEWQKSFGGTNSDYAFSIKQTTDDGYIVAGASNSNNGDVMDNHGDYDYWIVKLSPNVGIEEEEADENSISIYPNPGNEMLNVEFSILNKSKISISIYDVMGREVKRIENGEWRIVNAEKHTISFNVGELNSGVYFVKIQTESGIRVKRFVKE